MYLAVFIEQVAKKLRLITVEVVDAPIFIVLGCISLGIRLTQFVAVSNCNWIFKISMKIYLSPLFRHLSHTFDSLGRSKKCPLKLMPKEPFL